jgi:hypothetical protein
MDGHDVDLGALAARVEVIAYGVEDAQERMARIEAKLEFLVAALRDSAAA